MLRSYPEEFKPIENAEFNKFEINKIHPYFASFHPSIPGTLIQWFTKENDVVLDPFCGSGTTLVISNLMRRRAIGIDANPLACLISKVRTTSVENSKFEEILDVLNKIKKDLDLSYRKNNPSLNSKIQIPSFHNIDHWFKKEVQNEIGIIKMHLDKIVDDDIKNLCFVALSSIIVKVSNQSHETQYSRMDKEFKPYDAFNKLQSKIDEISDEVITFSKNTQSSSTIICEDLRNSIDLKEESVDMIATSPPYLNTWDYHLYQRFRMFWLGYSPQKLRDVEIGAHLTHYQDPNAIERYQNDMNLCLKNMYTVLKKGKMCCIVVGDSIVQGKVINIGELLANLGQKIGFSCQKTYRQNIFGPHYSQPGSRKKKLETLLILKKN